MIRDTGKPGGSALSSVESRVALWASSLPNWEQLALSWILAGRSLADEDVYTLLTHLLWENGLGDQEPPTQQVSLAPSAPSSGAAEPVTLLAVHDLHNVNALVPDQRLEFSKQATAVFGSNGAGKSGYARLLGYVGFTRGDKDVLPDAQVSEQANAPRSAMIELLVDGKSQTLEVQFDKAYPELSSVYVFDSTSVHVHLTGSNRLSFAPLGLDCLTRLAKLTDEVRTRLDQAIQQIETKKNAFADFLEGASKVRTSLVTLSEASDMTAIRELASFGSEEEAALEAAELRVARARSTSTEEQRSALGKAAATLAGLAGDLRRAAASLAQTEIDATCEAVAKVAAAQKAVDAVSTDDFRVDGLSQIGTPTWRTFAEAAQTLAQAEADAFGSYPQAGSPCLLCHRPLDADSRDLLHRLTAYLEDESQAQLAAARVALTTRQKELTALTLDELDSEHVAHEILEQREPGLLSRLLLLQKQLASTRDTLLAGICSLDAEVHALAAPTEPIDQLEVLRAQLLQTAADLKADDKSGIAALEDEWRELAHRKRLASLLPQVEQFVQGRRWAAAARKIGGNTGHITKQYNQLFSELVTDQYVERFRSFLKDLGRPMMVDVVTSGKKGEVQKRISLTVEAGAGWALTDKVLSEGEKRAVALADFLAEVISDTRSSAIVLDDPVTSLDLEWRAQIARVLARQARELQVIVFTHDLPFLYYFSQSCEEEGVTLRTHWVRRGELDGLPGYVHLDNCPCMEQQYKSPQRASDLWEKARSAAPELQEKTLKDAFGALRTTYEAFIVFDLFGGVVERFQERISYGRLKGLVWDAALLDEIIDRYEALSKHIEGHLHSDAMATLPSCDDLKREIDAFIELRKRLRAMKKLPAN